MLITVKIKTGSGRKYSYCSIKKISSGSVYAIAEFLNPGGNIKDRVAKHILESAQGMGALKPGMVIIKTTSGNTGVGLSLVGAQMGYRVICVMPENMSEERKKIIRAFGGETVEPRSPLSSNWS